MFRSTGLGKLSPLLLNIRMSAAKAVRPLGSGPNALPPKLPLELLLAVSSVPAADEMGQPIDSLAADLRWIVELRQLAPRRPTSAAGRDGRSSPGIHRSGN